MRWNQRLKRSISLNTTHHYHHNPSTIQVNHLSQKKRSLNTSTIDRQPLTYQSKRYNPTLKSEDLSPEIRSNQTLCLLIRGGFIRQSTTGIWTFLPNGIKTLSNIQNIIRQEMDNIDASEISMPLLQSSTLWKKSGRWDTAGKELFRLIDRKGNQMLLSPTHEEEITNLIKLDINSSKQLPVRLYHIGRKFRDELRPRSGLLRSREFIMKDLYTFDLDSKTAIETYQTVQDAYSKIFKRIGIPFKVAEADSGNIGGAMSHEYHYQSDTGEDTLIYCKNCDYTANSELAESILLPMIKEIEEIKIQFFMNRNKRSLISIVLPKTYEINPIKLNKIVKGDLIKMNEENRLGINELEDEFDRIEVIIDESCIGIEISDIYELIEENFKQKFFLDDLKHETEDENLKLIHSPLSIWSELPSYIIRDIRKITNIKKPEEKLREQEESDDGNNNSNRYKEICKKCKKNELEKTKVIEIGHTFYLDEKYSKPLKANYKKNKKIINENQETEMMIKEQSMIMGSYGIGISRLLQCIAEFNQREIFGEKKIIWPIEISPFKLYFIIPPPPTKTSSSTTTTTSSSSSSSLNNNNHENENNHENQYNQMKRICEKIYKNLEYKDQEKFKSSILIDDRLNLKFSIKLKQSELLGIPILIIFSNQIYNHHHHEDNDNGFLVDGDKGNKWNEDRKKEEKMIKIEIKNLIDGTCDFFQFDLKSYDVSLKTLVFKIHQIVTSLYS